MTFVSPGAVFRPPRSMPLPIPLPHGTRAVQAPATVRLAEPHFMPGKPDARGPLPQAFLRLA